MKKLGTLAAALALAGAGLVMAPAHAADYEGCASDTEVLANGYSDVCGGGSADGSGYVYVDGSQGNPDPFDGFVSASNDGSLDEDGLCLAAEGDPQEEYDEFGNRVENDEETPICNEEVPAAVIAYFVGG